MCQHPIMEDIGTFYLLKQKTKTKLAITIKIHTPSYKKHYNKLPQKECKLQKESPILVLNLNSTLPV